MTDDPDKWSDGHEAPDFEFRGFEMPRYTIVPDAVFDYLLPRLGEAELKVLLYIIRRTFGFQKNGDNIAISQMMRGIVTRDGRVLDEGTGLSKKSVLKALRNLKRNNVVVSIRREDPQLGHVESHYHLNVITGPVVFSRPRSASEQTDAVPIQHPLENEVHQGDLGEASTPGLGEESTPSLGVPSTPNKKPSQETESKDTDISTGRKAFRDGNSEERATILNFVDDFAREFQDRAKLKSSTTRAMKIYVNSGLELAEFIDRLYRARNATKERRSSIRGSPMAYFFRVLEAMTTERDSTVDDQKLE